MNGSDEGTIGVRDFQQWFGGMTADAMIASPTEPQDQSTHQTTADPDDHADEWNDPPLDYHLGQVQEVEQMANGDAYHADTHSTQPISQFNPVEAAIPQPTASPHPGPSSSSAATMQIYPMVSTPNGTSTNGQSQMNTMQPTYYSNGSPYSAPMVNYSQTTSHATPNTINGSSYMSPYITYGPGMSPHQVWQTNGGPVYASNGQTGQIQHAVSESPIDPMLNTTSSASPAPQTAPPMYTHAAYAASPPPVMPQQQAQPSTYPYTWTPEQARAIQQQQQQQQQQTLQQPIPRPIPAQDTARKYRASVVPIQAHPRVQQAQSASPMPTMSPTMMHVTGSPAPYPGPYGDMYNVGPQSAYVQSNPAAINPQALSHPSPSTSTLGSNSPQPLVNTVHMYKQYMQPQMMDAAPAQTAKKLINVLTAENTPETDPQTRLWLLTRIRDGAGKDFFKTWANDPEGMMLVKEWLRSSTPTKDGKLESGGDPLEWQETIMPLLQVIDRLPLGINQLRKSKIGSNILKLAKNPPNGGKLFTIQTHLENRMPQESNINACKVGTHSRYVVHERHEARASTRACQIIDPSHQLSSPSPSLNLKFINNYVSNNAAFLFSLWLMCALHSIAIRDLASSLENRYRSLMESHQSGGVDDGKAGGKRTEADTRGLKRKSDTPPIKTAAPAKRVAAPTPSPAAAAAARLLAAKREKEKEARAAGGTVTKETKSDSSFFTDTKPKAAPVKRVLPSFTKKPGAGAAAADVAQPSNRNTFEEALAHMGVKPKASTPSVSEPMEGVTPTSARGTPVDPNKPRRKVRFKPEEQLVEVRWIEKAIYDDDEDAFGAHHSLRDLDRDEGAAMHKQRVFEELIDWSEPMVLLLPDSQLGDRGQESEEAGTQAEREKTALLAHYLAGAIPPSPAEIPAHMQQPVDDSQTKVMLAGEDIDSLAEKPVSVAELLAKMGAPAGPTSDAPPPPLFGSLKDLGIDPNTFTQMLQQHNIAPVLAPPEPASAQAPQGPEWGGGGGGGGGNRGIDDGGWNDHGPSGYYDEPSHRPRFEDRGGRGRGRGRGRGGRSDTNDRGQKVCYFYPLGKCKYGDQCHNLHVG
ncbi:hypothetical protein BDV93DRAFT_164642 [Ceratobasidium sp. AG-I]|nr:hypothetical protein BDV93DRAFT_164642 [Ceratobasidium sp. AG-I]